jgi:epoxyqueuosine reductase QueG
MTSLTEEIRKKAKESGFISTGITNTEAMRDLPYGWVADVTNLKPPEEIMPGTRSVILLVFYAWDSAFSLQIDSPEWKGFGLHPPGNEPEGYYFSTQLMMTKAWPLVAYLRERGHGAQLTNSIPMKTAAIKCGLGAQGKNTLLINPEVGPRAKLMAILTTAALEIDEPYEGDPCAECERCIHACPTGALSPYKLEINRCLTYAAENPGGVDVPEDVRALEKKLIVRPSPNSFIECTTCILACPVGR